MKFLIVGCGIGGLSTAHALCQLGHDVILVERASELKPVGAGISVQPNAMQALRRLQVDQQISEHAWAASEARVLLKTGKVLTQFDFENYRDKFGFLPLTIFRGDLIRVLAETLKQKPGASQIVVGEQVRSYEETADGISVVSNKGTTFKCDALIGADGIHSKIREILWAKQPIRYSGYTCWRGMVEESAIVEQADVMTEVWGNGERFGFMRCNPRQVYWFATQDRRERTENQQDDRWKQSFESWTQPIPQILNATPDHSIVHNDIVDMVPLPKWSKEKVTLVGDAAHAMTPNFGQGGAQAIEDAVVLGLSMGKCRDVGRAFELYEQTRIARATSLVKGSWQYGRIAQGGTALRRLVRNHLLPMLPKRLVDKQIGQQCDFEHWLQTTKLENE